MTALWGNPQYAVEPGTRRGRPSSSVVVTGRWAGKGTGSGVRLETPFSSALTLRNGKVVRYEWFRDKAEALEAAGRN